ncbi:MAG: hypothetical protein ACJ8D6_07700 [Sphingomicrobium sp.]
MKKVKLAIGTVLSLLPATAYAMPAAVPQIYYVQVSHSWDVLAANNGFCGTPIGAQSRLCWLKDM